MELVDRYPIDIVLFDNFFDDLVVSINGFWTQHLSVVSDSSIVHDVFDSVDRSTDTFPIVIREKLKYSSVEDIHVHHPFQTSDLEFQHFISTLKFEWWVVTVRFLPSASV